LAEKAEMKKPNKLPGPGCGAAPGIADVTPARVERAWLVESLLGLRLA
jgi:hypothetical protein